MGVTLSTQSTLAPVSFAGTIIGFISFAFTIATFLRVFWENLMTLYSAPSEAHEFLTNLRVELYEEKASLRALRRHHRMRAMGGPRLADRASRDAELNEAAIRTMQDSLRHLIQRFKDIQRKFLILDDHQDHNRRRRQSRRRRRRSSGRVESASPHYKSGDGGGWNNEKGVRSRDYVYEDENEDGSGYDLAQITFARRFVWLVNRGKAIDIVQSLTRIQTRRIARQVGETAVALHDYGRVFEGMRESVEGVEGRLSRVVGIRRVE